MQVSEAIHLKEAVLQNQSVRAVWGIWKRLQLPDCWLVAGCLAQTVWNRRFGLPMDHGISDFDLVYFDPGNTSETSEQTHAERIRQMLPKLPVWIDVKNEARVHLWYEKKFGYPIMPYRSVMDAIDTFPTTATTVGMRPTYDGTQVYATFGFDDLFNGVVRANKRQVTREIYEGKISKWRARWPHLIVVPWEES
jgi:uncharacterized protein